jgi:uncharacterized protein (TIGR02466 family)
MTSKPHLKVFGPMLLKLKVDQEDINKMSKILEKNKSKDFSKHLTGNFEHEYSINTVDYVEIMKKYLTVFKDSFFNFYGAKFKELGVASAWVNFMKANDYNPPHVHQRCDFSTVLIVSCPDKLNKEAEEIAKKTNCGENLPGSVCFNFNSENKFSINTYYFRPVVGDFYLFPAWLMHWVNPFRCEGERVTVASNILIKES